MSLTLPEATIEVRRQAHEELDEIVAGIDGRRVHAILDESVQATHLIAMATSGQRIVTIDEIANELSISPHTVRARIRESDPPILPVKRIGHMQLFTLEDIPRIAAAHVNEVFASGRNTLYAAAEIRKAIAKVARKDTQARLHRDPNVRFADWGVKRRNRKPELVTIELHQHIARDMRAAIQADGVYNDLSHWLRAVAQVWLEQRQEKQT